MTSSDRLKIRRISYLKALSGISDLTILLELLTIIELNEDELNRNRYTLTTTKGEQYV